ncbi:Guanine nucleotide binding protein (G-protein) domain containing protein [Aphelenchoides besseyi]|nr:Guanine nucleotide binding protein (G-protein) domain containing protein [Aphelenchoides besseyi]KAI6237688.1 Guanine nucleotide binding protein (G-protein) domain containing protein [Aphelenchoides besseyi]
MAKKGPLRVFNFMGGCESTTHDSRARNAEINRQIERDRRLNDATIKLLLLGAGESGKSTILKQMKIIHDNGYTEEDALSKRAMVYTNVVQSMHYLVEGMDQLRIAFEKKSSVEHAKLLEAVIKKSQESNPINDNLYVAIKELTLDEGVRKALEHRNSFYLPDSAMHFINSLDRICNPRYVPTQQDILLLRISTMGVIEVSFNIKEKIWRVFDVGGQRSQRKKWIHCFDDARAVIFVVALSEYDQVLIEDNSTNRMQESLQLFKQVCNNKHFVETSIILFLNKRDLFMEKIGKGGGKLKQTFPDYNGPETYEAASKFIEKKFFLANEVLNKSIYAHHTCSIDTNQVQFVLDSVMDTILSSKLKGCGLY